ncbi:hypothetical protein CBS147332_8917 [Penicillium roqueforti]|nr:hypothetical protein CBS147332_8917 [Penicillium roqueforti]KAI3103807.1 hypothetical protein CBS147331_7411 [Penicillium roqueforti]
MGFITVASDLASLLCIMWNQNKPLQLETAFASNAISFTFCKYPGTASLIFNLPSSQLVACARHFIDLLCMTITSYIKSRHFCTSEQPQQHANHRTGLPPLLHRQMPPDCHRNIHIFIIDHIPLRKETSFASEWNPHGNCPMLSSKKKEKKKKQPTSSSSPDNSSYKKKKGKKRGKETNHKRREKKEEMDLHQTGQNEGTRKRDGKLVAFDLRKRKGFVP